MINLHVVTCAFIVVFTEERDCARSDCENLISEAHAEVKTIKLTQSEWRAITPIGIGTTVRSSIVRVS